MHFEPKSCFIQIVAKIRVLALKPIKKTNEIMLTKLTTGVRSALRLTVSRGQLNCRRQQQFSYFAQDLAGYRSLISVEGVDSAKFIQNLITNDVHLLNGVDLKSLYAMVLNNRGRILYDVLVYKPDANQTNYLIEVDAKHIDEAMRFFNTYKIKKKVS